MATRIVATGEVKEQLSAEDYQRLVVANGYAPAHAAIVRKQLEAGNASARFAVYGTALRLGHIQRTGRPMTEGKIVTCACGATYNDASAAMTRLHAVH